jgi:hypothetical protein
MCTCWHLPVSPQVKPEAKSYYELGAATLKFRFPEPAPLDGVTSRQKSILSMKKVRTSVTWDSYTRSMLRTVSE